MRDRNTIRWIISENNLLIKFSCSLAFIRFLALRSLWKFAGCSRTLWNKLQSPYRLNQNIFWQMPHYYAKSQRCWSGFLYGTCQTVTTIAHSPTFQISWKWTVDPGLRTTDISRIGQQKYDERTKDRTRKRNRNIARTRRTVFCWRILCQWMW